MRDIAIVCAGGFGREVKMLIDQINAVKPQFNFIGYFDDAIPKQTLINGCPVIGPIEQINSYKAELGVVLAIGTPSLKIKLLSTIINPLVTYPVLIHPNALIGSDEVFIGPGTIICAGNIITVNITIGAHVILNLACTVGHNTVIKDYCSFMPAVNISGGVVIEEAVYVGTGAKIINQLSIGANTIVGAGAVVNRSLPPNCTAVGIPAKPVKYND